MWYPHEWITDAGDAGLHEHFRGRRILIHSHLATDGVMAPACDRDLEFVTPKLRDVLQAYREVGLVWKGLVVLAFCKDAVRCQLTQGAVVSSAAGVGFWAKIPLFVRSPAFVFVQELLEVLVLFNGVFDVDPWWPLRIVTVMCAFRPKGLCV